MHDKKINKEIPKTKIENPQIKTDVRIDKYKGGHVSTNPPPKESKPSKK